MESKAVVHLVRRCLKENPKNQTPSLVSEEVRLGVQKFTKHQVFGRLGSNTFGFQK